MPAQDGQIELCPHQGCSFACCSFAMDNFIALYPGEIEAASGRGESVGHLSLVADERGGFKAICRAQDTSTCDGGYKPLDCASYPFFPTIDDVSGRVQVGLKGEKCPLQEQHLANHERWVLSRWKVLAEAVPGLTDWIRQTRLVGYLRWLGET